MKFLEMLHIMEYSKEWDEYNYQVNKKDVK